MASSVAVLGVGSMGLPLAHRLVTAGFRVLAYDADVKALERLPAAVQRVSTPREAADSARTVIGCLPSLQAYRQDGAWAPRCGAWQRRKPLFACRNDRREAGAGTERCLEKEWYRYAGCADDRRPRKS